MAQPWMQLLSANSLTLALATSFFRSIEPQSFVARPGYRPHHDTIILGAMMMRVGAKIREDDIAHMLSLLRRASAKEHLMREGLVQVRGALNNYRAGTPRDFYKDSCDNCGKTSDDDIDEMQDCERCKGSVWSEGWSCSQVGFLAHPPNHAGKHGV